MESNGFRLHRGGRSLLWERAQKLNMVRLVLVAVKPANAKLLDISPPLLIRRIILM